MSEAVIENILPLVESIERHSAEVAERMREAGIPPNALIVNSVAKYWDALEKLAAE